MRPIPVGTKGRDEVLAEPRHLANQFKDRILPPVFATPMMVLLMENAALNAIREFLDSGESALEQGSMCAISPRRRSGTGFTRRQRSSRWEESRVEFRVAAWEEVEEIGRGTHERMIVDLSRMKDRLTRKRHE